MTVDLSCNIKIHALEIFICFKTDFIEEIEARDTSNNFAIIKKHWN